MALYGAAGHSHEAADFSVGHIQNTVQEARLYEQYGEVKRELKEYGIIKQNVDSILRVTPGKEQAQEL